MTNLTDFIDPTSSKGPEPAASGSDSTARTGLFANLSISKKPPIQQTDGSSTANAAPKKGMEAKTFGSLSFGSSSENLFDSGPKNNTALAADQDKQTP